MVNYLLWSAHRYHPFADLGGRRQTHAILRSVCRQPTAFFHTADSPCSHPRATASENNAALGQLQASPQAPGQTTGVAGARLTMQPPKSYSVGGQRSSQAATGKPAGARPDYMGRWCAVSRGHPDRPNPPSPRAMLGQLCAAPWELPSSIGKGIAWI
ncbi:UNVERIFIED_CONTAM: hypothetical protein FKN15_066488 [Acipenser sinensis]